MESEPQIVEEGVMMGVETFSLVGGGEGDVALVPPSLSAGVPLGLTSCEGDMERGERVCAG